jgi:hypothetical protein
MLLLWSLILHFNRQGLGRCIQHITSYVTTLHAFKDVAGYTIDGLGLFGIYTFLMLVEHVNLIPLVHAVP